MIHSAKISQMQRGSALIICLVVLLAMTFIGMAGMRNSVLQERIVGAARDQAVAFEAAEAALRLGEKTAEGIVDDIATYPQLRPADEVKCVLSSADWLAPAELKRAPPAPTCSVKSYYSELGASRDAAATTFDPPEICIETGAAPGSSGYSECQQDSPRGLLFTIDAKGNGARGSAVELRSTFVVIKEIE